MRRLVAAVLPVSLLMAACGSTATSAGGEVSAVASVYPLAWMADGVAPDAEVTLLSAGGLEAHGVDISPGQRQAIQTSDVVLFVGEMGYQPQVEQAVSAAEGQVVSLLEVAGPGRVLRRGGDGEGAADPHLWFALQVMADAAVQTGEAFATADPADAEEYRANAATMRSELLDLGTELDDVLGERCAHREALVSHQAYGYLLDPYGIGQHGVTGINPETGASSRELAELVQVIETEGFGHVLAEPVEGREGAETVAKEAGVELLEISPLDAVTEEQAEAGFIDLVRAQATQFATALGC